MMSDNKHTAYDLAQMQSLPLDAKIRMTKNRIRAWYEYWDGQVYVSISGGKDSQVLAHIVKSMYKDVPLVFVNTGLEYDSVRLKGIELADEVIRPEMDFVSVITRYGYPIISKEVSIKVYECRSAESNGYYDNYARRQFEGTYISKNGKKNFNKVEKWKFLLDAPFRIAANCCNQMKKKPAKHFEKETGMKPIIGTMADESLLRRRKWMIYGCNAFEQNRPISQPLSFWKEQDVLQYIKQNDLQIAEIYGDVCYVDDDGMYYDEPLFNNSMQLITTGANRTGCVFCMFGITQDKERFLRLKEAEPQKYDYVMRGGKFDEEGMWIPHNGLGYKFVIDWLNEHGNLGIKY